MAPKLNPKYSRFIKDKTGTKTEMRPRSVNLTKAQLEFLDKNNLNLSQLTREMVDKMMEGK